MAQNKFTVFGMHGATCTQRVAAAMHENGAEFDLVNVDVMKGEQKSPAHMARQPFGKIPVLQDGDLSIYESRAICRYVDLTRGGKLTPKDPKARAFMEQWISLEQGTFNPEIEGLAVQRVFKKFWGQPADEDAVKGHVERVTPAFDVMEKHLSNPKFPYLAGEQFSLADVFFYPYVNLLTKGPEASIITSRPHVAAWWQRITSRPAWQKTIADAEKDQATWGKK